MFPKLCKIFKNTFFIKELWATVLNIYDALCDLVPFLQFNKRVTLLHGCFSLHHFQIVQMTLNRAKHHFPNYLSVLSMKQYNCLGRFKF